MKAPFEYYRYDILQPKSIRLLKIHHTGPPRMLEQMKGSGYPFQQQLVVSLESFPLAQCPLYTALSYTWGLSGSLDDPEPSCFTQVSRVFPIYCDDAILLGTWNLREALRQLRFMLEVRDNVLDSEHAVVQATRAEFGKASYFWIDALCINQEDDDERAVQVQLMGRIYKQAVLTIVWLGPSDRYTATANKVLALVGDRINEAMDKARLAGRGVEIESLSLDNDGMEACIALFNRRWFSRNWISQEAALSSKVLMVLGDKVIPIIVFEHARTLVQLAGYMGTGMKKTDEGDWDKIVGNRQLAYTNIRFLTYLEEVRASVRSGGHPDLFMILNMCRNQQCFDLRDKIYSILGICSEFISAEEDKIIPDYTIDLQTLYVQATKVAIHARGDLLILNHVGATHRSDGLPSWCPDYQNLSRPTVNVYMTQPRLHRFPNTQAQITRVIGSNLCVFGQCISTVEENVTVKSSGDQPEFSGPLALLDMLSRVDTRRDSTFRRVLQDMSRVEILWRTMLSRCGTIMKSSFGLSTAEQLPLGAAFLLPVYLRAVIHWRLAVGYGTEGDAAQMSKSLKALRAYVSAFESSLKVMLSLEPQNKYFLPGPDETRRWCVDNDEAQFMVISIMELNIADRRAWQHHAEMLGLALPESFISDSMIQYSPDDGDIGSVNNTAFTWLLGFEDSFTNLPPAEAFRTHNHLFGIASCKLTVGDQLWILHGAHVPLILRPLPNGNFRYVGETYMHGLMDGEALPLCTDPVSIVIE